MNLPVLLFLTKEKKMLLLNKSSTLVFFPIRLIYLTTHRDIIMQHSDSDLDKLHFKNAKSVRWCRQKKKKYTKDAKRTPGKSKRHHAWIYLLIAVWAPAHRNTGKYLTHSQHLHYEEWNISGNTEGIQSKLCSDAVDRFPIYYWTPKWFRMSVFIINS